MAIKINIACENEVRRILLGQLLYNALVGSPGCINNEIAVNYTDPETTDIVFIVGNDNIYDLNMRIDEKDLTY